MDIVYETPSWSINWSNITFIVAKEIDYISNIVVDGVEYSTWYSFSSNTITLSDAPTVSIYVSYLSKL